MARKKKQTIWAVCDSESDAFDGQAVSPFVWGLLDSLGNYEVFWNTANFVDYVRNSDIEYLYGHNGGKFDFMFPEVVAAFEEGKIMLINSRLAKAKIGNTELRDSFLCLPAPLAKFGEKDDFDYTILLREKSAKRKTEHKQKIEKYLRQDCVALFNAMDRFILLYGFALTQAGASMKLWEKMGGEKRRYGEVHDATFRPFYYGGRTQVFEYCDGVKGDFELYDINSSYPFAMTHDHPCGTDYSVSTNIKKDLIGASFWTVEAVSRGALPVKTKFGTTYPDDDTIREYHATGWEIMAGIETGTLEIISARGLIPRRFENMKPYVEKFYSERLEAKKNGDIIGDVLAKIFMNSLYGKYGSNPDEYKDYLLVKAGECPHGYSPHMQCGEYDILQKDSETKTYFDVALAASVTGFARAKLWRAICECERPMYCDTDSILCDKFNGETGGALGQWKLEAEIKAVWIAGKKCYAMLDKKKDKEGNDLYKTAHKGVSKIDATVEDIKRAAAGEVVAITKSAPTMKLDGRQLFLTRRIKKT